MSDSPKLKLIRCNMFLDYTTINFFRQNPYKISNGGLICKQALTSVYVSTLPQTFFIKSPKLFAHPYSLTFTIENPKPRLVPGEIIKVNGKYELTVEYIYELNIAQVIVNPNKWVFGFNPKYLQIEYIYDFNIMQVKVEPPKKYGFSGESKSIDVLYEYIFNMEQKTVPLPKRYSYNGSYQNLNIGYEYIFNIVQPIINPKNKPSSYSDGKPVGPVYSLEGYNYNFNYLSPNIVLYTDTSTEVTYDSYGITNTSTNVTYAGNSNITPTEYDITYYTAPPTATPIDTTITYN